MPTQKIEYGGTTHEFPDNFTQDDISAALSEWDKQNPQAHSESLDQQNLAARSLLAPTLDKLKRNINTRAGGMGYGEPTVPKPNDTGVVNAITRTAKGVADLPGQLFHEPQTDKEKAISEMAGMVPGGIGRVAVALQRALVDPSEQAEEKADEYGLKEQARGPESYEGRTAGQMKRAYKIGSAVPVVGPMAANLTERAMGGDPSGALTEAVAIREGIPKAGELLKKATGKAVFPMVDEMENAPTGRGDINPAEAYSGRDIKAHAESLDIPMTPAEITENGTLRAIQGVGQKSAFGKDILQKHQSTAQSKLIKAARGDMNAVEPRATNELQVGRDLKRQVTEAEAKANAAADKDYADWRSSLPSGPIDIDLSPLQKKYGNQLDINKDIFDNIPTEQAGKLRSMLGKAKEFGVKSVDEEGNVDINPRMDLEAVREMRSHWMDTSRELERRGRGNSREASTAKAIVHDLDQAIENGLREHGEFHAPVGSTPEQVKASGDSLVNGWRKANASWKKYIEDFHGDDSVLSDILKTGDTDLVKLPGHVLEKTTGGNPIHVDQLRQYGIKLGGLQRSVMDRALNQGYRMSQNKLAGFDDDFLQHVFADNPEMLDRLYKNARVGRSIGVDFNPSNTAGTVLGRYELESVPHLIKDAATGNSGGVFNTLTSTLFGRAAARLSTSKWFNKWMTNEPKGPVGRWLLDRKSPGGGPTPAPPAAGPSGPPSGGGSSTPGSGGGSPTGPVSTGPSTTDSIQAFRKGQAEGERIHGPLSKLVKTKEQFQREGEYGSQGDTGFNFGAAAKMQPERRLNMEQRLVYGATLSKLRQDLENATTDAERTHIQEEIDRQYAMMRGEKGPELRGKGKLLKETLEEYPEGRKRPGVGPGAMLRPDATLKLVREMKSGPQTGNTAQPVLNKLIKDSGAHTFFEDSRGLSGDYDPEDILLEPGFVGQKTLSPKELEKITPVQGYVDPTIVNQYMDAIRRGGVQPEHVDLDKSPKFSADLPELKGMPKMQPEFPPHIAETIDGRRVVLNGTHRTIASIKMNKPLTVDRYVESEDLAAGSPTGEVPASSKLSKTERGAARTGEGLTGEQGRDTMGGAAGGASKLKKTKATKPLMQQLSEDADKNAINNAFKDMAHGALEKDADAAAKMREETGMENIPYTHGNAYEMLDMIPKPLPDSQKLMTKYGYRPMNEGGLIWSNGKDEIWFSASGKFFDPKIRTSGDVPVYNSQDTLAKYLSKKHGEKK